MEVVLRTTGLTKRYKRQAAVDHAEMTVCKGDIYGFVGENGSGKTTIIRLITGLIFPTEGGFELFGVDNTASDIGKARSRVGAIVESPSIYTNMSAYDNLKTQSILLGVDDDDKIREVLCEVGLEELYGDRKRAGNFSLGMRQRLGIAMALMGDPEFLILDEPMNGLDPAGIVGLRELILQLNRERGITFLISSHILTELALVATKYGIISKGRILKEITAEQLRDECGKTVVLGTTDEHAEQLMQTLSALVSPEALLRDGAYVRIAADVDLNAMLGAVIGAGIPLASVNCRDRGIEDYYLSLIGGVHHA